MRDFKGMKRQRGRNRGGGGGGKPQQQNANRAFDSNGPDGVKVRGNAQHVFEKYQQLARDAGSAGDRVLAENYLQHAEHYFRLIRAMQPQRPASEILGRDQFSSGFDIDFEDESGAQAAADADAQAAQETGETGEAEGDGRDRGGWQGRERDGRDRGDRDERRGDDRPRDRFEGRRDRDRGERDERRGDDRPRDRFEGRRDRDDRDRGERDRGERGERDRSDRDRGGERRERSDRGERPERDPMPVTEPQATPLVAAEERPSPMLRDAEGGQSHAPAFLQSSVAPRAETPDSADEGAAPAKRPRRRRAPRSFEAGSEGAAPSTEAEEV